MAIVPSHYFLTRGTGVHEKDLRAFEEALREAGIPMCNLVKISSIIPPGCQRVSREEGIKMLKPGQITFSVIAQSQTNEPGQKITAGIGLAQPKNEALYGYLSEAEEIIGRTATDVAEDVEEMALENLVTGWGHKFDASSVLKPGKREYKLHGEEILVDSLVQTATGADHNLYTVVLVLAVLIY
jgi:arginine decarboxylase